MAETKTVVALDAARVARGEAGASHAPMWDGPLRDQHESLTEVYIRMRPALKAFLHRRTGDVQAAEELAQELWLKVADQPCELTLDNPDAWLQRIAANLALDWLRRHRFRTGLAAPAVDISAIADHTPSAERILHARQGLDYLRSLLDELPPRRRAVFLLYRGQGLSLKATAKALGISPKTVQHQAAEALEFLRRRMADAGLWP